MSPVRLAAAVLPLLLAAACAPGAPPPPDAAAAAPPPAPPNVVLGGCTRVLRGPVCVPPGDAPLTLWVPAPSEARVLVDGHVAATTSVGGGLRTEYRPPAGATTLSVEVHAPGAAPSRWQGVLGPPDAGGPAVARAAEELQAGREARRAGRSAEALERLANARRLAEAAGALSESVTAALVAGFVHFQARRFEPQAALLSALPPLADPSRPETWHPEGEAHRRYHLALSARERGDVRGALEAFSGAAALADLLGGSLSRDVAQETAVTWLRIGRLDEAMAAFDALEGRLPPDALCEWPYLHTNRGWARLLAVLRGPRPGGSVAALADLAAADFDAARRAWARGCDDWAGFLPNLALNEALLALARGRAAAARRALDRLPPGPLVAAPDLEVWRLDLESRLALEDGRRGPARSALARLAALAEAALLPEMAWRARLGHARLALLDGRADTALAHLEAAERLPDEESRGIPVDEGRLRFLGDRQESARRLVDLLVDGGRVREALDAARRARRRGLVALTGAGRPESLPANRRAAWSEAWEAVVRTRGALDDDRADDWKRTDAELAAATRRRADLLAAHRRAREGLFELLGGPSEIRPLPPVDPEALTLAWFPGQGGWHAFAVEPAGRTVHHAHRPGDPPTDPADAVTWAIEPFLSVLRATGAAPVRLLPYGSLRDLDLHMATVDGRPLTMQRPVVYGLDLAGDPPAASPRPGTALVVADPQGNLAGSAEEGRAVVAALERRGGRATHALVDRDASVAAVTARLGGAQLFHFAGHGVFAGREGWESALLLAGGGRLTTGDLLALREPPTVVVLSGCETGRAHGGTESPLESLGLAQAFVVAGSRAAVAAARRVSDADTRRLFADLYTRWDPATPVAAPLGAALAELSRVQPHADIGAFRVFVP